jgi:hypothetical protein
MKLVQAVSLLTLLWRCPVRISSGTQTSLTEIFRGSPQSPLENSEIIPKIRPRPINFPSFEIHYALHPSPFDATQSELLAASLNIPKRNKQTR